MPQQIGSLYGDAAQLSLITTSLDNQDYFRAQYTD